MDPNIPNCNAAPIPDAEWIRRMPKIELHLHLEGSIRPELLRRLARKNAVSLPQPISGVLDPAYQYSDFSEFLQCFKTACSVIASAEDLAVAAESLMDELLDQNAVYAEIFLSPIIHERRGIDAPTTMRLIHGIAEEKRRRYGLQCRFLFDAVRQWGVESCRRSVHLAEQCREWGVVGIGIGGDESMIPAAAFAPVFAHARDSGLHLTAHAGEACGAESVRDVLLHLQPERIGHGIRAAEDAALVRRMKDLGVTLDISLTSNACTGVWSELSTHPAQRLYRAGVSLTLNTDDPALFCTTLTAEYRKGAQLLQLDGKGMEGLVGNALRASFLTSPERLDIGRRITAEFSRLV